MSFAMNTSASNFPDWHGTTILAVRKNGRTVIAGDGQVSMGPTIVKGAARKAMKIAADICVYTNGNLTVETLGD